MRVKENDTNRPLIVGISGRAGSGKDTLAKEIGKLLGEHRVVRFADPLKRMVAAMLEVPVEWLEDRSFKERKLDGLDASPRDFLKALGKALNSEFPGIFEKLLDSKVQAILNSESVPSVRCVLVPDVRFVREICQLGGYDDVLFLKIKGREDPLVDANDPTELGIADAYFDLVVNNAGTVQESVDQITKFMSKYPRLAWRLE